MNSVGVAAEAVSWIDRLFEQGPVFGIMALFAAGCFWLLNKQQKFLELILTGVLQDILKGINRIENNK